VRDPARRCDRLDPPLRRRRRAGDEEGPMVFFTSESRWENHDGEVVKVGEMTTIYD
jgi:hypothetical protein